MNRAATYFQGRDGAGPLLHVIAAKEARAADVVLVARSFQEHQGTPLATPHVFWPGTSCGGPTYKAHLRTPSDCATGVAVAFSSLPGPSGRGLTDRPAAARPADATPDVDAKPEPATPPPVSDEFCDKRDIRVAMNRAKGSFRFCYQRELQSNPELTGRVVLRFTIGTDGRPKGASIASSTLGNKTAHSCILKTAQRMTFKPPKGGVCPVRWPFNFQPK
jgi:TonB family protein